MNKDFLNVYGEYIDQKNLEAILEMSRHTHSYEEDFRKILELSKTDLCALADILGYSITNENYIIDSKNEIGGFLGTTLTDKLYELKEGDEHSVEASITYFKSKFEAENVIGFHTHPNDYNEFLFDKNEVVDLPSGEDVATDLSYSLKIKNTFKNSIQAVVVPSRIHNKIGIFIYKQLIDIDLDKDAISGYYQIVKLIYLDFDKKKALDLFETMDSNNLNSYMNYLKINVLKENYEKYFFGPKNLLLGTANWPWKNKHFSFKVFEICIKRVTL